MGEAREIPVYTEDPAGGGRVYLGTLGAVTDVDMGFECHGGPTQLSCSLWAPPDLTDPALLPGRRVYVTVGGARRWFGRLLTATPGTPWQISAVGVAALAKEYRAIGTNRALDLNSVVDNAISRGLWWSRPAALPTSTATGSAPNATLSVADALSKVGNDNKQFWAVDASGAVTMAAAPSSPTYLLRSKVPPMPVIENFATHVIGIYQSSSTATATVTVTNTAAEARYGAVEGFVDLTSRGVITSTVATQLAQAELDRSSPRLNVTEPIQVSYGDLLDPGGAPVDLATVTAGCVVRVQGADAGRALLTTPSPWLDLLIGTYRYQAATDVGILTPAGDARRDLLAILAAAAGIMP